MTWIPYLCDEEHYFEYETTYRRAFDDVVNDITRYLSYFMSVLDILNGYNCYNKDDTYINLTALDLVCTL